MLSSDSSYFFQHTSVVLKKGPRNPFIDLLVRLMRCELQPRETLPEVEQFLVPFAQVTEVLVDHVSRQFLDSLKGQCLDQVDRLAYSRFISNRRHIAPDAVDELGDFRHQPPAGERSPSPQDSHLLARGRRIEPGIETS